MIHRRGQTSNQLSCEFLPIVVCGAGRFSATSKISLVSYRPLALKKTNLIVPVMRSSVSLLAEISSLRHTRNRSDALVSRPDVKNGA